MSTDDNYLKLLEKMSEIMANQSVMNNELSHIKQDIADTRSEISQIKHQDVEQNRLLDEHILGVQQNTQRLNLEIEARKEDRKLFEKQIEELDLRMKKAEFIPKLVSDIKTALAWVGGVATALAAIGKLLNLF